MNLVQKLPIGLSLACLIAMSSCSKEDVQTLAPESVSERSEANMRGIGGAVNVALPYFAKTNGQWGQNSYANDWHRKADETATNLQQFPSGTSARLMLWGDDQNLWVNALPEIPEITDLQGFVTISTKNTGASSSLGGRAVVETKLKNLQAGKKYELTFYVATNMPVINPSGSQTTFAKEGIVKITNPNGISGSWTIPLSGKYNQWIKKVITFTPYSTEAQLEFTGSTPDAGYLAFTHLFVDKNSIKQVSY